MKVRVFCLLAVISVGYVYVAGQYTTKFDNIDIDQVLSNERLFTRYVDCFLEKPNVRCPAEAVEAKVHIREGLETECAKCSDRQKEIVRKVISYLVLNKKDWWEELKAKYDPENKYSKMYEDRAREEGIQI